MARMFGDRMHYIAWTVLLPTLTHDWAVASPILPLVTISAPLLRLQPRTF